MIYRIGVLATLMIFALCLAAWQKQPVPPYIPNGDEEHAGQPQWCQREDTGKYQANCTECENHCEDGQEVEDHSKCKTSCRKGQCQCHAPCST